jgi:polyhydroxybutyrate depolymerase
MAYRLACALSSRLAAIAAVAADSQECQAGEPTSPVSVLHVHGTNDNRNNGRMQALRSGAWVETATDAAEQWSRLDGCAANPGVSVSGRVTRSDWQPCSWGTVVTSYSILGGDHGWPRSAPDTTRLIADFLRASRRAGS